MTRLFDLLYHQLENYPTSKALSARNHANEWESLSTQQIVDMAEQAASGLLSLGLQKGDKVALVSYKNRPEWVVMDFAIQMVGMISVPLYPTISVSDYEYILEEAEVKAVFCGGLDLIDKLKATQNKVKSLQHIYVFDKETKGTHWSDLFNTDNEKEVGELKQSVASEDLATIIYTSGTTGNPKGVMLSHRNIMHVVKNTSVHLTADKEDNVLSFLPLCHIFERAVAMVYVFKGAQVHFVGTDNLSGPEGDLQAVKPVTFSSVPRLLEKVYEAIYNKGLALEGVKRKLFFWALELANDYEINQQLSFGKKIQWKIAHKLIFSKWREALGGNVRAIVTGAAPCPVKILQVFCAAGIPLREGYGLTETSPTISVNTMEPDGVILGTTGPCISGVEVYIEEGKDYRDGEGEILVHGPSIMMGYYKKPAETEKVFLEMDGKQWFRTGDIGTLVNGANGRKFLKITDRKKELLKTSGGKYVAPAPIENKMKEDFLIEQMMVVGDKQKFVTAIIVPAEEALKNWCSKKGVEWEGLENMVKHKKVLKKYQKIIDRYNPLFSHIEQVKKFALISKPWLPVHGDGSESELTPTLKLKRRVIRKKFSNEIAQLYAE